MFKGFIFFLGSLSIVLGLLGLLTSTLNLDQASYAVSSGIILMLLAYSIRKIDRK